MDSKYHALNVPKVLPVVFLLITLCGVSSIPIHDGLIENGRCSPSPRRPRPDRLNEGARSSIEELTGRCFSMDIRGFQGDHNSAHVAVIRNDYSDFCLGLIVKEVEIVALGYLDEDDRSSRLPIGTISTERLTEEQLEQTCSASQSPDIILSSFHTDYAVGGNATNVTQTVNIFTDCEIYDQYIVTVTTTTTTTTTTAPTTETTLEDTVDTEATEETDTGATEVADTEATEVADTEATEVANTGATEVEDTGATAVANTEVANTGATEVEDTGATAVANTEVANTGATEVANTGATEVEDTEATEATQEETTKGQRKRRRSRGIFIPFPPLQTLNFNTNTDGTRLDARSVRLIPIYNVTSYSETPSPISPENTTEETLYTEDLSSPEDSSSTEKPSTTELITSEVTETIPPTTTPYIPSSTEISVITANSLRIVSVNGTSLGGEGELFTSRVVACGLWKYTPFDLLYPFEVANAQEIYIDFVAELSLEYISDDGISETLFRYVGKRPRLESPVIKPLPALYCQSSQENYQCPAPESCEVVKKTFHDPQVDIHTSFYESVSDSCFCYAKNMKNKLTEKKYKWGGFHYGLFLDPGEHYPKNHPDEIFKDCLKLYFKADTNCIVFAVDGCTIDPAIAKQITLEEVHIFALGAKGESLETSVDALPFGRWENVKSLGNCGNLVNDKAPVERAQMFPINGTEMCRLSDFGTFEDVGMPENMQPEILRLKMDPPLTLGKNDGFQSLVYAARLSKTLNFTDVPENNTVQYINFVLEAYAKIERVPFTSTPYISSHLQVFSMKTPIMQVEYEDKEMDNSTTKNIVQIKPMRISHPLPYFQLDPTWHDKIYNEKEGQCSLFMGVFRPSSPPPPARAFEDACNCYTGPRSGQEKVLTVEEFLEDVATQAPLDPDDPKNITKDCFTFDHFQQPKYSCTNPSSGGKKNRYGHVLVYFGLSCQGPAQLEVRDMIIQANNELGYPIGNFEDIDYAIEADSCRSHINIPPRESNWVIREVRPVSTYDCPDAYNSGHHPQELVNTRAFYQPDNPTLHFFNHNLTLYSDETNSNISGFGYCVWWRFNIKEDKVPGQGNKDQFYFDLQFSAIAQVEYRPTHKRYVVGFRTHKAGFNTKTCFADKVTEPVESNPIHEIHMNKDYYDTQVRELKCIPQLDAIDTYETGMCGCFVGNISSGSPKETHRVRIEDHPDKDEDPIRKRIDVLQQCVQMTIVGLSARSQPLGEYSLLVEYNFRGAPLCQDFWLYEVVFEVLNEYNMPMGKWDLQLYSAVGKLCAGANTLSTVNLLSPAELVAQKCPENKNLTKHYRTTLEEVYVLQFRNRWKDTKFKHLCVVWRYPKDYAEAFREKPSRLPRSMQIYSQAQIFDPVSNMLLTAPVYSDFKVKYDKYGGFTELERRRNIQHISDFNSYLHLEFNKQDQCIQYPPPPDYLSTMCKMFQLGGPKDVRIDLNNNDPDNTKGIPFIKAKCFTFTAYPGNEPLSMHLTFTQQNAHKHLCASNRAVQFSLTAYNELGFPIGRTSPGIGWTHYEHPRVPDTDRRYCEDENIEVVHETLLPIDNSECKFIPTPDVTEGTGPITDATMKDLFLQEVTPNRLPNMIVLGTDRRYPPKGICFHWVYDSQLEGQKTPSFIQFYIEFFVPKNPDNLKDGWKFILRSKKIEMNYTGGQEHPNTPARPAKHCHNESDPYKIFKPMPFPKDNWDVMHRYNIYPDKNNYRRCIEYKEKYGTCTVGVNAKETSVVINPVVIIPGGLGTGEEDDLSAAYTNSTKIIYDGCIAGKVCYSPIQAKKGFSPNQPDCIIATDCEMVWAVGKQPIALRDARLPDPGDDHVVVEVFAASTTWIAIGLSKDDQMGDDYVLECVRNDREVDLFNSWNFVEKRYDFRKHDNIRIVNSNNKLPEIAELVAKRAAGSSIYCMFYIKKRFTVTHPILFVDYYYDLVADSFCILNAYGEKLKRSDGKVTGIGSHLEGKRKGNAPCKELTSLNFRMMPTRSQVKILQNHGAILTLAYLGFLNTSIFVARYYQQTLTFVIFGYQLWIWIHGLCAACAAFVVLIGWFTVYPGLAGWQTPLTSPFHQYMGYLTVLIALGNIVIGAFIRKTSVARSNYQMLYTIHAVSGHFTSVIAHFIIMLTDRVEYAFIPCHTGLITVIWIFVFFGFHVAMSFHRYWVEKFAGVKPMRLSLFTPLVLLTQKVNGEEWLKTDKKANKTRLVILAAFCVFTWGFALTIAIQVVNSHHSCSLENNFRKLHPVD